MGIDTNFLKRLLKIFYKNYNNEEIVSVESLHSIHCGLLLRKYNLQIRDFLSFKKLQFNLICVTVKAD